MTTAASGLLRSPPASVVFKAMIVGLVLLVVTNRSRVFYPGSAADAAYDEPLPPGDIGGCPWLGSVTMFGGMNKYLSKRASRMRGERIWKMFGFGKPLAIISGSDHIRKLLNREFEEDGGVSQVTDFGSGDLVDIFFGSESMTFETSNAKKHHLLQRLVGQALTPESVARGMPSLQRCAEGSVSEMLASKTVVMEDVLKRFTVNIAWRQIIGLNLKGDDDISAFRSAVAAWMKGVANYFLFLIPWPMWLIRTNPSFKAKAYLNRKIEERIDELEAKGPDGSTMSAMVFATDKEDGSATLSRQQVIDNTFLLILAGSETSSNTLVNAMLLIGMHPDCWDKLVSEQEEVAAKHGVELTKDVIDKDCPYLNGVVKETMRLLPISFGGVRELDETLVLEGYQIPKGYWGTYSAFLTHEQDSKTYLEDGSHMDIRTGFKPERWLDEETRPTTEFIPFGAGHRFCLGHTLAMAEMKTFIAIMARRLRNFDLITNTDKLKWKEGVIITPKDGVVVAAHGKED
uniref:Cytochrome P450 n=1 Tax=Odontella aurita TaxID=265563 RepID=A0A7S4IGT1_9STRA